MTNFTWIDGSIVGMYLLATMIAGIMVRKYVSRVDHFLVAGREMNVYLGIASLAATEFGIVTCMYTAQAGYTRGFSGSIPGILNAVAMFVIGWTGFCVKPLRDSGAITIPELFEQRYGKFVRWLAGVVIVLGGLLNMGVFLRVGGQFLVVCCGMNLGYLEIAMTVLLVGVAVYTIMGGMLSVLVTDFLQFVVMSAGLLAVSLLVLSHVGWERMVDTVQLHYGEGGFNPFVAKDLGWAFVLSNLLTNVASVLTWQTCIARLLAAKDSKTGRKVYTGTAFFFVCRWIIPGLWGIAALAMIEPAVVERIGLQFGEKDGTLFAMPYLLAQIVPAGMMGVLVAAMLAADMSTDSSYMLTWGSVIYNDIMAPLRTTAMSMREALLSFGGRMSRLDFWAYSLIILFPIGALNALVLSSVPRLSGLWIACLIVALACSLVGLAMLVKRWHDRGHSAWWLLVLLLPILIEIPAVWSVIASAWRPLSLLTRVFQEIPAVWIFIELCLPGTVGPNRFGPDPLQRSRTSEPWSEKKGILWNRCIVALIGVFLLVWGLWYKLEGNLWEYLQTTGAIYLASMSALLIACCYWKRANNWGAIAAIVVGAALPVLSLSLNLLVQVPMLDDAGVQVVKEGKLITEGLVKHYIGDNFVNIGTFLATGLAMILGSLLKSKAPPRSRDTRFNAVGTNGGTP